MSVTLLSLSPIEHIYLVPCLDIGTDLLAYIEVMMIHGNRDSFSTHSIDVSNDNKV